MTTYLEDRVCNLYNSINITHMRQLDIETVSSRMEISCEFIPHDSMRMNQMIFIDERLTSREQWQSFAHEVAHIHSHVGNQLVLPPSFYAWQEWRANNFMSEFCVPRFLLEKCIKEHGDMHPIEMITTNFNVTHEFALHRFRRWQMNRYQNTIVRDYDGI